LPTARYFGEGLSRRLGVGGHYARWLSGFELHIFPRIGKNPVDRVDSACVVFALSAIWLQIPESARRLLQRIGVVLDFAHIKGWLPAEVSLRSVRKGLPRQNDKRGHMEAMPYAEVPASTQKLANAEPTIGRNDQRRSQARGSSLPTNLVSTCSRVPRLSWTAFAFWEAAFGRITRYTGTPSQPCAMRKTG
jgi:hypothetical protein